MSTKRNREETIEVEAGEGAGSGGNETYFATDSSATDSSATDSSATDSSATDSSATDSSLEDISPATEEKEDKPLRTVKLNKDNGKQSQAIPSYIRSYYQSCIEEDEKNIQLKEIRKEYNQKKRQCETDRYSYIFQYFKEEQTLKALLYALFDFYKQQKRTNNSYTLTLRDFIYMFPRDSSITIKDKGREKRFNFRRQHVFEAMCRLLLLFNYDNDYFGKGNKIFYKGLEKYVQGKKEEVSPKEILNSGINEGSAEGKVDIFFKIGQKDDSSKDIPPCEEFSARYQQELLERSQSKDKDLFVLIQNKFMEKEYSSADKYDVTTIGQRARPLASDDFKNADYKIVLMVNNKSLLDKKIQKARHRDFNLVSDIFGLEELEQWFQNLLYDIYKSDTFNTNDGNSLFNILQINMKNKEKPILENRFHQELIVRTTSKYLNHDNTELQRKKFIWGCVPRSGKSYMVAGLVNERNIQNDNNILIILGAKRETEGQFQEMFEKYDNFNDYEIITANTRARQKDTRKNKFIFILSQELIKFHRGDEFSDIFKRNYPKLFERKNIDLYFDEIHKGGSTARAQDKLIKSLLKDDFQIDLFVMVTATYARPSIAYNELVSPKSPVILNWSYIDQQRMKTIHSNEMTLGEFKESRINDIERDVIDELLIDYEGRYGSDYKRIIEDFYKKYPELVIIQPYIEIEERPFNIHGNLFRLQCSAIGTTEEELKEPNNIFEDNNTVKKLLNFIGRKKEDKLDPECLYGKLAYQYKYDVINKPHTQLWFLPYSDLYTDRDNCGFKLKQTDELTGYEEENKISMPNIEPLTRGLVLNLLNDEFYKEHFCFLIVQGKPSKVVGNRSVEFYNSNVGNVVDERYCVRYSYKEKDQGAIGNIIRNSEREAYKQRKSLIILTGQMLRLGISVPCADIALNFDSIKSLDQNYQTMFRVLTERKNKSFGYYFDFYPDRSIDFLYQFNEIYGEGLKKSKEASDMVSSIQSLLYLFNYNGVGIKHLDTKKSLELYDKLVDELKLNQNEYRDHYIKNNQSKIRTILNILPSADIIQKFKNLSIKSDKNKKTLRKTVKKGERKERSVLVQREEEEEKEEDENEDKDDEKERLQNISELINTVVNILAIFSYKESYHCDNIIRCIDKILEQSRELEKLCNCNKTTFDEGFDVLGCYLNKVFDYSKEDYRDILIQIKEILNDDKKYYQLRNLLNIIFYNIRSKLGGDTKFASRLIQNGGRRKKKTKKRNIKKYKKRKKTKKKRIF